MDVRWYLEFTVGGTDYYWSTQKEDWNGNSYTFNILPDKFSGITMRRASNEFGLVSSNELTLFVHSIPEDEADMRDIFYTLRLVTDGTERRTWKLWCDRCDTYSGETSLHLVDFLTHYLENRDFPSSKNPRDIWPSDDPQFERSDNYVIPEPVGTAYIPLRNVNPNDGDGRWYVLGPTANSETYTITEVSSPIETSAESTWGSGSYTFNQETKDTYRMAQFIIMDSDNDDTADANGLWKSGAVFLDTAVKFTRSDTSSLTSPEDYLEYWLEKMGIASADIDTGAGSSFETAGTTYSGWSLTWNGGFYTPKPALNVLSNLLSQCHSTLRVTDKIELHTRSATSQTTIDSSEVVDGTFKYAKVEQSYADGGYVRYVDGVGTPQDRKVQAEVPVYGGESVTNPSNEVLDCFLIRDDEVAQRLGILYFQRKFNKIARCSFTLVPHTDFIALHPDQVVTVNDAIYGDSKTLLIESITYGAWGETKLTCLEYKYYA